MEDYSVWRILSEVFCCPRLTCPVFGFGDCGLEIDQNCKRSGGSYRQAISDVCYSRLHVVQCVSVPSFRQFIRERGQACISIVLAHSQDFFFCRGSVSHIADAPCQ
jgi:hypothetical protein